MDALLTSNNGLLIHVVGQLKVHMCLCMYIYLYLYVMCIFIQLSLCICVCVCLLHIFVSELTGARFHPKLEEYNYIYLIYNQYLYAHDLYDYMM